MNFGETISNNDLDVSYYKYDIKRASNRGRVFNISQKERKSSLEIQKTDDAREEYMRLVTI